MVDRQFNEYPAQPTSGNSNTDDQNYDEEYCKVCALSMGRFATRWTAAYRETENIHGSYIDCDCEQYEDGTRFCP